MTYSLRHYALGVSVSSHAERVRILTHTKTAGQDDIDYTDSQGQKVD
jgi:hypothetical protein